MLRKLIKYEFKAVNRLMIPLHLGLIAITIFGRFYVQLALNRPRFNDGNVWMTFADTSLIIFYVIALVAIALITSIYLSILRFQKNLFTDEGYLMHTLPVSVHEQIWGKLIVATVWIAIDTVLLILSILVMFLMMRSLLCLLVFGTISGYLRLLQGLCGFRFLFYRKWRVS